MNLKLILYLLLFCALISCSGNDEVKKEMQETKIASEFKNALDFGSNEGVAGVFYIPEMLTLCVSDSCNINYLGAKLNANYTGLKQEIISVGAEANGPLGQIKYNNDPKNFKFECIALIRKIPAVQPKFGKIVILETTPALVYNFYGPYEELYTAYEKIKVHMQEHQLEASGPMREFYEVMPSDSVAPKDAFTRIMIPVKGKGTK